MTEKLKLIINNFENKMHLRSPPFTTRWVTAVALGTYACLFALVIQVHEVLPSTPSSGGALDVGIDLKGAWSDLNTVCPQFVGKPNYLRCALNKEYR
jgi:hypothetical protein